jgi:hypothetical protein
MRAGSQACSGDRSLTLAARCWSWFRARRTASGRGDGGPMGHDGRTAGRLNPGSASAALKPLAARIGEVPR